MPPPSNGTSSSASQGRTLKYYYQATERQTSRMIICPAIPVNHVTAESIEAWSQSLKSVSLNEKSMRTNKYVLDIKLFFKGFSKEWCLRNFWLTASVNCGHLHKLYWPKHWFTVSRSVMIKIRGTLGIFILCFILYQTFNTFKPENLYSRNTIENYKTVNFAY